MEIGTVRLVDINEEMKGAYLDYAMSVITARALPDVRDGLKPVQRRILYAMHDMGLRSDRPYKKSARIVGETLGKYHPHGDQAVYDAMVRMAQDFSMRYPLVDGQGNFGCFTGDTKIKLLDGTERSFEELAKLDSNEVFYVYSVDKNGRIVVGEGRNARVTRRNAQIIELVLDNGETIRCTPDHRFMLRDGTFKEAQHLTEDDSLMPGYFDMAPVREGLNDYLRVLQPAIGEYEFVHHLADEFNERKGLAPQFGGPFVRHHKNFDRWDNRPTNIKRMGFLEHLHLHAEQIQELWEDPEFREAQRRGVQRYYHENPEVLEERRRRFIEQNKSEAFRQARGKRVSRVLKRYYRENPEARAVISRRMKALWEDPDYRAKMREALADVEKRELTPQEKQRVARIISEKSRAMWADDHKRAEITEAIARALASEEVRAKLSEAARRNWQDPEYRARYPDDHFSRMAHALWADPATRKKHGEKIARQWEDEAFRKAQREGVRRSNARRLRQNPAMMEELTASAAATLTEKWADPDYKRRVMRKKIAGYVARLLAEMDRAAITPEVYQARRDANWIPNLEKALAYFEDFDELLDKAERYNHRIVAIRWLDERVDVYDITVDEHHNFLLACGVFVHNSVDGDSPAAMRYTEARLTEMAEEMLVDINKGTVDFVDNFDGTLKEPSVLPAKLPNLLLNGASGIAVGMATNIPPHNLVETCDALIHLIDNYDAIEDITVDDLMKFVKGPDFPTGGIILGSEGIRNAYATGKGRVVMRARAHIEEIKGNRHRIVVTELPYQVNKSTLIERIASLVREKRIDSISDLRDESDRQGMHVVIELKRGAEPRTTLNQLLKYTQMQQTFGVNLLALVDGEPRVLPLRRMLHHYLNHRQEIIRRRSKYDLAQARHRAHILEGLRIALANLDEVIQTIRRARNADTAKRSLRRKFKLSEIQAQAILDMQLRRLAALERRKIQEEYKQVIKTIAYLEDLLASPRKIRLLIRQELLDLRKRYGDARRTLITEEAEEEITTEDLIPREDILVTITRRGYVKRVAASAYRPQRRGGRGVTGITTRQRDQVQYLFIANTLDSILFFTDQGRVFHQKAHQLPDADRTAKGIPMSNLLPLERGETVTAAVPVPGFHKAEYLVMATIGGKIKRTELKEFEGVRPSGIIAITLEKGDALRWVKLTDGDQELILVTERGQAIRFHENEVRPMGRVAGGVNAIKLAKGDRVASMDLVRPGGYLLVVTTNGYGKCSPLSEYPAQSRYGLGVRTTDVTKLEQTGPIATARVVEEHDEVTFISADGIVMRTWVDSIPQMGRAARGALIMSLKKGDSVASVARLNGKPEPELPPPPQPPKKRKRARATSGRTKKTAAAKTTKKAATKKPAAGKTGKKATTKKTAAARSTKKTTARSGARKKTGSTG